MIIHKLREFCKRLLLRDSCVRTVARSTSVGIFIAFSPYVGLHTVMAILFCSLFSLNYPITLSVQLLINNPWTLVPVLGCDYYFGKLITQYCNLGVLQTMPECIAWVVHPVANKLGMSTQSFWAIILGGNVLGLLLAIVFYKPTIWIVKRLNNENNSAE